MLVSTETPTLGHDPIELSCLQGNVHLCSAGHARFRIRSLISGWDGRCGCQGRNSGILTSIALSQADWVQADTRPSFPLSRFSLHFRSLLPLDICHSSRLASPLSLPAHLSDDRLYTLQPAPPTLSTLRLPSSHPRSMRRSLVALALFTTAALAASDPVRPSLTELLLGRHGDDEDEEPSHEGGMEGMHDHHSSAGYFNSSSWYGPDGQVMEPVPGLDSPMPHTHHQ